ncbi:hypothetical protein LA343_06045 [Corynebacterium falsenii]|uniref:hypothetical protein n=1 Tax=Corynebacterium falsenii TaxID=108486 RepID=UPI0004B89393|nr:hypothetical protein [Corynebacterium falsenii]UBI03594.1 hypothetical protein LA343_06045 [Corynebacterium falsenii]UBI06399.1 hypothetical protein LA329_08960 [Corynebacterium falsenii]
MNYNGLALLLGVSMSLVIGGNYASPKEAGIGGLLGGAIYTIMLIIAAVTLYLNIGTVAGQDVPMLELINHIHPVLGFLMAFVIFFMVFNTAIGMFYALGKRLTANGKRSFRPTFIVVTLLGFVVSFVGFETLMTYVYPVLGYIGLVMIAVMVAWWIKSRDHIKEESKRRDRIHELTENRENPDADFSKDDEKELKKHIDDSPRDDEQLKEKIEDEVTEQSSNSSSSSSSD